jgi:hypothetical protein
MLKSTEEKRAYAKGYNTGRAGRWPDGVPPIPNEYIYQLAKAAKLARDLLDSEIAMSDGELESKFGPAIDAVDAALEDITTFALSQIPV